MTAKDFSRWPDELPQLEELVEAKLSLTIAGQTIAVPGSHLKLVELTMTTYGLSGRLMFWVVNDKEHGGTQEDKLFAEFIKPDLIEVSLSLLAMRPGEWEPDQKNVPLAIKGLVSERMIYDQAFYEIGSAAVMARLYGVRFSDPAALSWQQHHPCAMYTDKTLQDVLDEHKGDKIILNYQSQVLSAKRPQIFLGHTVDAPGAPSFYDFVIWLCDRKEVVLTYSYDDGSYQLADEKPQPGEQLVRIHTRDLHRVWTRYAPIPRFQARVLNAYTEDPRTQATAVTPALSPLFADNLIRTPIGADFDARATLEGKRLRTPMPQVQMAMAKLPLYPLRPGDFIDLRHDPRWDKVSVALPAPALAEQLRVVQVELCLRALDPDFRVHGGGDKGGFRGTMQVTLEPVSETAPALPAYINPVYPRMVEGKIVSEEGADDEDTYQIETAEDTKLRRYKVKLPLFADQIVKAPFEPASLHGHMYFPLYKNARVLCALGFDTALIRAQLDWRVGAPLPDEAQGNHLLMGKKPESSVSLRTVYEDGKPAFTIERISDKDWQIVQLKEGFLRLRISEKEGDGTRAPAGVITTTLTVDKKDGTKLIVENPDGKVTQTVHLDGTQIKTEVKDDQNTSTITQIAGQITVKVKDFLLDTETFTLKSSKASQWQSQDTLSQSSQKDFTIKTAAALNATADGDGTVKAKNLTLEAQSAATLKGMDVTTQGSSSLTAKAPSVTVKGDTTVSISGASTSVKGSGTLTCESSGSSTFKGSLVSISGSLIQVG